MSQQLCVSINKELCIKCGKCSLVCPSKIADAVCDFLDKRMEHAEKFACLKCGHCMAICPTKAFQVEGLSYEEMPLIKKDWPVEKDKLIEHFANVRSVRTCTDELISDETIVELLDAAETVASAKNQHLTKWGVIKGKDKVKAFADGVIELLSDDPLQAGFIKNYKDGKNAITRDCSHIFFVFVKDGTGWDIEDGTIVMHTLNLLLPSYGLSGTWSGFAVFLCNNLLKAGKTKVKELIGQPDGYHLVGALIGGYPSGKEKYLRVPKRNKADIAYIK